MTDALNLLEEHLQKYIADRRALQSMLHAEHERIEAQTAPGSIDHSVSRLVRHAAEHRLNEIERLEQEIVFSIRMARLATNGEGEG